jgi:hypothetical protein
VKDLATIHWPDIHHSLDEKGFAQISSLLSEDECHASSGLYAGSSQFRSTIIMQRYRFGKGEYKYFNYPLPKNVQQMREALYVPLASLANEWMQRLSMATTFPSVHNDFLDQCHAKGQHRPTPLLLQYETGGFNTLHQDLYGEVYFPFQVVILLSEPDRDFEGGEFVMTEQIPRAQSRAYVINLRQGDALIFTTNFRPAKGARGHYSATMKHGISEVTSGKRCALGIIFHDAA